MGKFVTRNARELHEAGDAAFVRTTAGIPDGPTRFDFTKADNRSGISASDATTEVAGGVNELVTAVQSLLRQTTARGSGVSTMTDSEKKAKRDRIVAAFLNNKSPVDPEPTTQATRAFIQLVEVAVGLRPMTDLEPKEAKKSFGINGQLDTVEARLGMIREKLNVIVESRKFAVQKANSSGLNGGDTEDMVKAARAKGKRIGGW